MKEYLEVSEYIDWDNPAILELAKKLAADKKKDIDVAKSCFEWVRDEIKHSWDYKMNPVTCKASEVLKHGTGYCFAKSHLLAALLRANNIPAGLCYQRLSINDDGAPYSLHGFNAVFLQDIGWYRVDPRGNKEGVDAQFIPPKEQLAFPINENNEKDFPDILVKPHNSVVEALNKYETVKEVFEHLPDTEEL
ncbi:MAG: transglutaminase family protein [Gammaproteobacteria bacterium]|nr:transglutaminase family protein [Gammaproteobacteria bacterium]